MGNSSGFKSNNFHESERKNEVLSHSDFAINCGFDEMDKCEELVDFLLKQKKWEQHFIRKKSGSVNISTDMANKIFYTCWYKYNNFEATDSVIIFSVLTDFYGIEPKVLFWKLVKKCRMILIRDLGKRIDSDVGVDLQYMLNGDGQQSFKTHLKDTTIPLK